MAKKLIIHAGLHKTGSTSIQKWCAENAAILNQNGVNYPLDKNLVWDGHHRVPWGLGVHHPSADPAFDSRAFIKQALQNSKDTVLLSSEDFEFVPERGIRVIKEVTKGLDVQIIIFIRNIIDYLISDYQQNVRMSATMYPYDVYRFSFQYNAHARMDYFALLQKWVGSLGREAVTLLRYEAKAGSVVPIFKEALGLPDVSTKDDAERANPSLKAVSLRVLQELNKRGLVRERARASTIQRLYDLEESGDSDFSALDSDMADAFIKAMTPRIQRTAREFNIDADTLLVNTVEGKRHVDNSDWQSRLNVIESELDLLL